MAPIGHPETGILVTVDKGWLDTVVERFGEAIRAVNLLNDHVAAVKLNQRCMKAVNATGKLPTDCPAN